MKPFNDYLQTEGYTQETSKTKQREVDYFKKWCTRNHTTPQEIDYKTSLKYIQHLSRKKNSKKTINHKLASLKTYFDYLIDQAVRTENPIEDTVVKGAIRTTHYNLLDPDELEDLYYSYQSNNLENSYHSCTAKRDKILVGMLVYQGLDTRDFKNLKLEHLQLQKGELYIPSSSRSNARTLELKPWQLMELFNYVNEVHPELQKRSKTHTDHLFPYVGRFSRIHYIIQKLKKINQKVTNSKQIRASVITNWLQKHSLRKAQYMAGHRYISSTERYLQDDLENLHEIVNNFHPIS